MQLLNSNIPQGARTTKYGNKKNTRPTKSCAFCFVAFSYYKDGSPSRVCKKRSDGIAIVRTFQPPLHLSKPQVRNRVTYDTSEAKACDGQKKRHHLT